MMPTQRELKGQKSDMNLRAVEHERELTRQRTSKAWKSSLPISQEKEGNRNEGIEDAFSSDEAAIAVTEGEDIEPKTVKDAECQTIEFDYIFPQTSRYQAPNQGVFDTDDKVRLWKY